MPSAELGLRNNEFKDNDIRALTVSGRTVPQTWENAVKKLWLGKRIARTLTEYDSSEDPYSRATTMMMIVTHPLEEPRIHRAIPDGLRGLYKYTKEVIGGVHDYKVRSGGWSYSYSDRLHNWPGIDGQEQVQKLVNGELTYLPPVNQINYIVQALAKVWYTRRAQAITWNPQRDPGIEDPPCLQRIWCEIVESGGGYLLDMNTHWRSRDALKGAFMNMYALTTLQGMMAEEISRISGKRVEVGRYVDITDNFHIYGSYMRKGEIQGFIRSLKMRSFEGRTFRSDDQIVIDSFAEEEIELQQEIETRHKFLQEDGNK
ncbi:hypothetical protein KKA69_02405 [Patescibacteria group bacterium]|nr:hypothetical protein [Patescibacteria group bacterium]